jgi:hypothetical protein
MGLINYRKEVGENSIVFRRVDGKVVELTFSQIKQLEEMYGTEIENMIQDLFDR